MGRGDHIVAACWRVVTLSPHRLEGVETSRSRSERLCMSPGRSWGDGQSAIGGWTINGAHPRPVRGQAAGSSGDGWVVRAMQDVGAGVAW